MSKKRKKKLAEDKTKKNNGKIGKPSKKRK